MREVIALDPSGGMLDALRDGMAEHRIPNIRTVLGRWPWEVPVAPSALAADVALIAHVGYDIEAIGPFLDAMEAAASRLCVAVMMEQTPSSIANPFWPPLHGEQRVALPAMPEFLVLLLARGRVFEVVLSDRPPRHWPTRAEAQEFVRRQLWLTPGSAKDRRLSELLAAMPMDAEGFAVESGPLRVGVVSWEPR